MKGLNPGVISKVGWVWSSVTVVDSDWRFDNLCGSHLQGQSELYHVRKKKICSIRFILLQVCPSAPPLVLLIPFFKFWTDIFMFHLIWWQLPELQIWWNSWYWAPWFNFRNLLCSGIVQQNTHKHDGRPSERLVPITGLSYLSLVPRSAPWLMLVKSQRVCRSPAGLFNYIASNLSIAYCMIISVECQWTSKTRC